MPEWIIQLGVSLVSIGAIYGAIRSDLKNLHDKAADAREAARRAHVRIDDHIDRHHVRGDQ